MNFTSELSRPSFIDLTKQFLKATFSICLFNHEIGSAMLNSCSFSNKGKLFIFLN